MQKVPYISDSYGLHSNLLCIVTVTHILVVVSMEFLMTDRFTIQFNNLDGDRQYELKNIFPIFIIRNDLQWKIGKLVTCFGICEDLLNLFSSKWQDTECMDFSHHRYLICHKNAIWYMPFSGFQSLSTQFFVMHLLFSGRRKLG